MSTRHTELSRSSAARLAREGKVWLRGRPGRPSDLVHPGDSVVCELEAPGPPALVPEAVELDVIYQDGDLVVVNKPAGMVVHPAPGHASGTLVHALLGLGGQWSSAGGVARPGIVHRLDRGTSGLILAARTDQAHRSLAAQLASRTLTRTYLAVVKGQPDPAQGLVEGPIGRDRANRLRMAVVEGGRWARTSYRTLEVRAGMSLLLCGLESGRTHQIRVHLSRLGHPLVGDPLYGGPRRPEVLWPLLHAHRLRFVHPRSADEMSFEVPMRPEMADFWSASR